MKLTIYQLSFTMLTAAVLLSACSKNDLNLEKSNTNVSALQNAARLGFDTTDVVIRGDTIIVEGDIVLIKSDLNKTSPRQASIIDVNTPGVYPIARSNHRSLKYYISPTAISWEAAISDAFNKYNSVVDLNLKFSRTYNINEANVKLESGANYGAIAEAHFPSNGQLGSRIGIDIYAQLSESQKIFVIAHEIGHTVGLRHTDWRDSELEFGSNNGVSVGAYTIPGTPNSSNDPDPNSVFNSGNGMPQVPNWTNFSFFDITALTRIYPAFENIVMTTNPDGSFPIGANATIFASVSIPNWIEGGLTYEWTVQGVTIQTNSGHSVRVRVTDPNSAAVHCRVTNAYGQTLAASKSFGTIHID